MLTVTLDDIQKQEMTRPVNILAVTGNDIMKQEAQRPRAMYTAASLAVSLDDIEQLERSTPQVQEPGFLQKVRRTICRCN